LDITYIATNLFAEIWGSQFCIYFYI